MESFIGPGMPPIRAQNDLRRAAFLGDWAAALADTGGLRVPPVCALYDARPLAFRPPLGFLPSLRCHAAVLATATHSSIVHKVRVRTSRFLCTLLGCLFLGSRKGCALFLWIWLIPECFTHGIPLLCLRLSHRQPYGCGGVLLLLTPPL